MYVVNAHGSWFLMKGGPPGDKFLNHIQKYKWWKKPCLYNAYNPLRKVVVWNM